MNSSKDRDFVAGHLKDLALNAYDRNIYRYSDFLGLSEIGIINDIKNQLPPVRIELTGGNYYSERKIAIFSPEDIAYDFTSPIRLLKISPVSIKFSEKLSHRDYLGSVLGLSIERKKIGDIFLSDSCAYVYCLEDCSDYIIDNLIKVKHTNVSVIDVTDLEINLKPNFKDMTLNVASTRVDSVVANVFKLSRSKAGVLISSERVFVNGILVKSLSYMLKDSDIVSVRGFGRFIFNNTISETRKGREVISVSLYD